MKAWATTLILASVIGALSPLFLPKGEKSPLYGVVKLVSALVILTILIHPVLTLMGQELPTVGEVFPVTQSDYDPERLLLERSCRGIEENVRRLFPDGDYELVFETDEEEQVITAIRVETEDSILGEKIAQFLREELFSSIW